MDVDEIQNLLVGQSDSVNQKEKEEEEEKGEDKRTLYVLYGGAGATIIMVVLAIIFLGLTLNDIKFAETRESCTAPYFTNPGDESIGNVQNSGNPSSSTDNAIATFSTKYNCPETGASGYLDPYPCSRN